MVYVFDTHALVWFFANDRRLGKGARDVLASGFAEIVIPAIVLAEIKFLESRNRIGTKASSVVEWISKTENCAFYPVDEDVIEQLPSGLNIHDALIVATALVYKNVLGKEVRLVTKDEEVVRSGLVERIW